MYVCIHSNGSIREKTEKGSELIETCLAEYGNRGEITEG